MGGVEVHSDCVFTEREGMEEGFYPIFQRLLYYLFMCAYVHMNLWRSEVNLKCCSSGATVLETGSLIEIGVHLLDEGHTAQGSACVSLPSAS